MNQTQQLEMIQQIRKEYKDKKEVNTQIKILKEIALKGKQTKPELAKSLKNDFTKSYRIIAITLLRDSEKEDKDKFFRENGEIEIKGVVQKQYSLTHKAMKFLMVCHYRDNETNREQKIVGDPYLNRDEFLIFISKFEREHYYKGQKSIESNISLFLKLLLSFYLPSNPSISNQLSSKFKTNLKLQQISSVIKSDETKLQQIKEKKVMIEERIIDNGWERTTLLSEELISSLKKSNN
jgi:hypothetical protein